MRVTERGAGPGTTRMGPIQVQGHGQRGWLEVKVNGGHRQHTWTVLHNGIILLYRRPDEERAQFVYPLHLASLSFPSSDLLILDHQRGGGACPLEISAEPAVLLRWHSHISAHIREWRTKRRLSILFNNRMRITQSCKLDAVSEASADSSYHSDDVSVDKKDPVPDSWSCAMGRVESAHRLRELSLIPDEERCSWSRLPEVVAARTAEHLSEEQRQSNELLFNLVISEIVYNQELSRLVDLARASVRWKDSLPLFNRRSIIGCCLKVKKCSDSVVRTLEDEWYKPHSLAVEPSHILGLLESSFTAATAQAYISYCDNLDDTRTLFRRATQTSSISVSSVVSARCHIECALLPIQKLHHLRGTLDKLRKVLPDTLVDSSSNQLLLQSQQLYVTVSGIIELCYKVLSSLHGTGYLADIDNMLDFSNKLSTLRKHQNRSPGPRDISNIRTRPRLPLPEEEETNQHNSSQKTLGGDLGNLNGSFNLIDLSSVKDLLVETKVDSVSSSDSVPSSSSGMSSIAGDYELIELKNMAKNTSSGDSDILEKTFEELPIYQIYNAAGKALAEIESNRQSKSIFYSYLNGTENVYEEVKENKTGSLLQLRTLWKETKAVVDSRILDKLTPCQIALQESKFEILTSEVSYLKSLNILITLFVESSEFNEVVNAEDRCSLFSNILEVRKASEMFLFDLTGQWEEDFMLPDVCSVIQKHAEGTFRVYIDYCSNQARSHQTLERLKQDNERFLPMLAVLEALPECQGYTLQSFLMLPVQRVTRLPLLIQAVQRRLDVTTSEFNSCTCALMEVDKFVKECNENVRVIEAEQPVEVFPRILQNERGIKKDKEEDKLKTSTLKKAKKVKNRKRQSSLPWKFF